MSRSAMRNSHQALKLPRSLFATPSSRLVFRRRRRRRPLGSRVTQACMGLLLVLAGIGILYGLMQLPRWLDTVLLVSTAIAASIAASASVLEPAGTLEPPEFRDLVHFSALGAQPKAHIAYSREAWVSEADNSVRVTNAPTVTFALESYWDEHYRRRPWFRDKERWAAWQTPGFVPPPPPWRARARRCW